MRLINPSVDLVRITDNALSLIECAGRTCYKSEHKIRYGTAIPFIKMLLDKGHESVLEHASMTVRVICDRGVSHEIVRHRLFSFCQESTRYCSYKDKEMEFVIPSWLQPKVFPTTISEDDDIPHEWYEKDNPITHWTGALTMCELRYKSLLKLGWTPQQARSVLPNSLKTEMVVTGNFREWKHFFTLRCTTKAHPDMYVTACQILDIAQKQVKFIFDDIGKE